MDKKVISPCISICRTDPVTGYCYGCARNNEEKKIWKEENTTNEILNYFSHVVFSYQGLKSFTGINNIERALKTFAQKTEISGGRARFHP